LHRKLFFMSFEMGEVTVWNRYCDTMISTWHHSIFVTSHHVQVTEEEIRGAKWF
jgi:hypothetical protein